MGKVHEFTPMPGLTDTSVLPAARRSAAEEPANLSYTPAQMATYLRGKGFLVIQATRYNSDAEAAAGGVPLDGAYIAGNAHISASPNTLIIRSV